MPRRTSKEKFGEMREKPLKEVKVRKFIGEFTSNFRYCISSLIWRQGDNELSCSYRDILKYVSAGMFALRACS
jgi:hypothetical protein